MTKRLFHKIFTRQAVLWSCLFLFSCENSQSSLDEWQEQRTMNEEGKNIQTIFSQSGQIKSKLTAPVMIRHTTDTQYVEFPKSLRMLFYDSTRRVQSQMDARYGKYFEGLNKAYLRDSVVVASVSGDTLWTSELWWDQNTQLFTTDKRVKIHRKNDTRIYGGKGLRARQDLTNVVIFQVEQPSKVLVEDSTQQN